MSDFLQMAKLSSAGEEVQNAHAEAQGRKGVCCLSTAHGAPKEKQEKVMGKPSKIFIESFMRRPSLSDEAASGIMGLVNDSILVEQSAYYRTEAEMAAMMFIGDQFRIVRAGDIVVLHFVNGMLLNPEELEGPSDRPALGSLDYSEPDTEALSEFGHGENTFLFCTRSFANTLTEELLEDTLQRSVKTVDEKRGVTTCDCARWLKVLREIFEEAHTGEEYTVMAVSIPPKKERPGSKKIIMWVVIAIVAALLIFFVLGAFRRGPGAPGGPGGQQGAPDQNQPGIEQVSG